MAITAAGDHTVLQIGFGNFGPVHLRAWLALGFADRILVADPDADARSDVRIQIMNSYSIDFST